ncbi:molybdopterin-guanine dinucleotide biosynthesis protein MobA [Rhizobium sp. R339]|uniref:nucleotidyltransferase family protein n=1 Tax=Rhizobium sp. R339 TaxID=1764273 RepID=UPI000B5354F6|nr:nucleotidyltransferase family protein [Rhizobium sp. R339]OWV72357.1 molybdopterin-guanine dinucleotide biosynthesis protein MobA [Rhizobium sp. R339]
MADPPPQVSSVAIVILAAGQSSRMGGAHKLLAEFGGMPLIRRSAITASNCESHSVIVVTGYRHAEIEAAIADLPVKLVHNAEFSSGMARSLALGVAAAEADQPDGIMIMLADMPALTAPDLDALIAAFRSCGGRSIVRATAGGRLGNPVIFPRALYAALKSLTGDKGARELIKGSGLPIADIEIGDGALIDVDTPDAIEAAGGILRR